VFRRLRVLISAGCALSCAVAAAAGQATGAIDGIVRDATGAALSQVTVRVVGPAIMGPREDLSREDGFYRIQALTPGEYEVTFTRTGFEHSVRRGVRVRPGATTTVSLSLTLSAFRENVIVAPGVSPVDRRAVTLAAGMDARELAALPGSRSAGAILAAGRAVHVAGFDVGGNTAIVPRPFTAYGFTGYSRPTLEGIDISQHQRFAFSLDYGSFDQAWVGLGAYGSSLPSPGVHVQVLAKSGGDRYGGSLYAGYQNGAWQAHNISPAQVQSGAVGAAGFSPRDTNRLNTYRDLNADVGGFFVRNTWWWYASVRDQHVEARVVSFPVKPIDTSATIGSAKTTLRTGTAGTLTLYAHPAITRQPHHLGAFLRPEGVHLSEESTADRETRGIVWKAEWNTALSPNLLGSVRIGQFVVRRTESPNGGSPRVEDLTAPTVFGGNRSWREDLRRTQVSGSLSYLHEGRGGRHQIAAGAESVRALAGEVWYRGYPGDVLHVLAGPTPSEVYLLQTPSESWSGQQWTSAFVTDSWYVHDRLTISGGLRFDRFRIFLPGQVHPGGRFNATSQTFEPVDRVALWNAFAPRVGISLDPLGDGRTLAKFSYGLYTLPPGTDVGFNANPNARTWWDRFEWTDANGNLRWEPGEEGAFHGRRGGTAAEPLDPALKLAYAREATAYLERDLGSVTLTSGVMWRAERQQGLRQLTNRSFEMFTVATVLRDPGPAGTTLDADGEGPGIHVFDVPDASPPAEPVLRNVRRSHGDYITWEVSAARRVTNRWSLFASASHTWSRDHAASYLGQIVRENEYAVTPNDLINTDEGGRHVFRTWTAKAHGTWLGPWGIGVTPLLRHQSGQPFGRTVVARLNAGRISVLAEPVGTRRQDNVTLVDVSVHKDLRVRGSRRMAAFVEVFNLFNANPAQTVSWASGPAFLRPLSIVPPRIARVGLRVDW
jgi:hypothetical protein